MVEGKAHRQGGLRITHDLDVAAFPATSPDPSLLGEQGLASQPCSAVEGPPGPRGVGPVPGRRDVGDDPLDDQVPGSFVDRSGGGGGRNGDPASTICGVGGRHRLGFGLVFKRQQLR